MNSHALQQLGHPDEETSALADKALEVGKPIEHFEVNQARETITS